MPKKSKTTEKKNVDQITEDRRVSDVHEGRAVHGARNAADGRGRPGALALARLPGGARAVGGGSELRGALPRAKMLTKSSLSLKMTN